MSSISLDSAKKMNTSPYILILGVGGTIAGLAAKPEKPLEYQAGQVGVGGLLEQVKKALPTGLNCVAEQLANIDSRNLSESLLTHIGLRVKAAIANPMVQGVVITHGTDTIEETGFFLDATCGGVAQKLGKRVVLTGAMLPSNALNADGPQNLLDAIHWAALSLDNCPGGVYGVFYGKVCLARDLAKRHTTALNAPMMDSPFSPIGLINPSWLSQVKATHDAAGDDLPIPENWPWVEILTSHAGARPQTVERWLDSGVAGLVLAGTGMGGLPEVWTSALQRARVQGIALVRTSRVGLGKMLADTPEQKALGCISAGYLSAPRARIALQLALNAAEKSGFNAKSLTWQDYFARIAVLP